jgi:hypothetical protein
LGKDVSEAEVVAELMGRYEKIMGVGNKMEIK